MKLKTSDNSFFGRDSEIEEDSIPQPDPFRERVKEPVKTATPTKATHSVIGENIKFRGELIGTEDIHIEGSIEGTIIMEGHNLSVGAQGEIDANVHANNITINGKLTGDILADELIAIKKSAVVKGNLIAPRIQLDDGGKFRGSMDMVDSEQERKERLTEFKEKLIHPHLPQKQPSTQLKTHESSKAKNSNNSIKQDIINADSPLKKEAEKK